MDFQKIWALIILDFKRMIREPARLFILTLFPVIITLIFGIGFANTPKSDMPGMTVFDYFAPALFGYACIWIILTVSLTLAEDREGGLIKRLNTTPTTSGEFFVSQIVSNTLIAFFQVAIVTVLVLTLGYRPDNGAAGFLLAYVFVGFLAVCSVGLGLITATITKSSNAVSGVAMIFLLPQMLFGANLGIPTTGSFEVIARMMPNYYATNSLYWIFWGAPLTEITIWIQFAILAIISIVVVIIGIQLFKRFGKA